MAVANIIEITAGSKLGFADAIKQGIASVNSPTQDVTGVWIQDQKCVVESGAITEYRVALKVTYLEQAPKVKKMKITAQVGTPPKFAKKKV